MFQSPKLKQLHSPIQKTRIAQTRSSPPHAYSLTHHLLGKGAHSKVFLATRGDPGNLSSSGNITGNPGNFSGKYPHNQVACKIVNRSKPEIEDAIFCEITALKNLKGHKNIVELYFVVEKEEHVYIFLEFISGENLNKILTARNVTAEEVLHWINQLLSALQFCHKKLIAHLDVKCENLVLDSAGNIKLIDFGMSISAPPETSTNPAIPSGTPEFKCECYRGSPIYMAPEVFSKKPFNPFKSDIWAAGIVYYRLLSHGGFPWKSKTFSDLVHEVNEHKISFPDGCGKDNVNFLNGCLELSPKKRVNIEEAINLIGKCK
jgi:serine/threonine protein kinase